jgi:predicted metal-dependent HD superfamily phosphohydrolase
MGTGEALMHRLIAAYNEPHRKYHTEQHLRECLIVFDENRDFSEHPVEVEIALWFHDAIYNLRAHDNEERSADWAVRELNRQSVHPDRIKRIKELILVTKHSALPVGPDQELLVDIDLSILGANSDRFEEYERQVREEYRFVPRFLFKKKRREILSEFLNRNPIYATSELRLKFENQARSNMTKSIRALRG